MLGLRNLLLVVLGCCSGIAGAQVMPSASEFERAVATARPEALALGLNLRTDGLWLKLLQSRVPMLASLGPGICNIGYSAYHPRADFSWLFPALPPEDRDAWLGGFIRHELAHCADMQDGPAEAAAASADGRSDQWQEVLADLAFALHVDQHSPNGGLLIERLASLRAARASSDPGHDSSAVLRCYLAQRDSWTPESGLWLARLRQWRKQCLPTESAARTLPPLLHQATSAQTAAVRR